jgi:SOS response regulatory protein OraA/RecX
MKDEANKRVISNKIEKLINEGYDRDQAVAIAYNKSRKRKKKKTRKMAKE